MSTDPDVDKPVRALRIVVAAMIAGTLAFGMVALLIGTQRPSAPGLARVLLITLGLLGIWELAAGVSVRRSIMAKARRSLEALPPGEVTTAQLMPAITTVTIVTCAMAEGFGLFGLVVFLLTGSTPALPAPLIALIVLTFQFPTRDRVSRLVSDLTGRRWH